VVDVVLKRISAGFNALRAQACPVRHAPFTAALPVNSEFDRLCVFDSRGFRAG
jgi:hypothetical protein